MVALSIPTSEIPGWNPPYSSVTRVPRADVGSTTSKAGYIALTSFLDKLPQRAPRTGSTRSSSRRPGPLLGARKREARPSSTKNLPATLLKRELPGLEVRTGPAEVGLGRDQEREAASTRGGPTFDNLCDCGSETSSYQQPLTTFPTGYCGAEKARTHEAG